MAKFNPDALKIPECVDNYLDNTMSKEECDKLLDRLKRKDSNFDAEGMKKKLEKYEQHIRHLKSEKISSPFKTKKLREYDLTRKEERLNSSGERERLRDTLKKRAALYEEKLRNLEEKDEKLKKKIDKRRESKESNSNKERRRRKDSEPPDPDYTYSAFKFSKDQMCNFLERQKNCCEKLEKELYSIQSKLDNVNFTGSQFDTSHVKLMEDSAEEIDSIVEDFQLLQNEVKTNLEGEGYGSDIDEGDYEKDLDELRKLQKETGEKLDLNLDIDFP